MPENGLGRFIKDKLDTSDIEYIRRKYCFISTQDITLFHFVRDTDDPLELYVKDLNHIQGGNYIFHSCQIFANI